MSESACADPVVETRAGFSGSHARDAAAVGFGARFVTAISIGSVLNPINSSIIAIALVPIGRAFHQNAQSTSWLVSGLYLATAVGQPTMGKLADQVGARSVYLAGLLLVAFGGAAGVLASNLEWLVLARVVIGLGTSAAYPAAMDIIRRQSERLDRPAPGSVLGVLAMTAQVSMAMGPLLGGLLMAIGGWRWTFAVNLPLTLMGAAAAIAWIPHDRPRAKSLAGAWAALDAVGAVLFAGALIGLLLVFSELAHPSWPLWLLTAVLWGVFIIRETGRTAPFIDVRMLFANHGLSSTYLRSLISLFVIYSFIFGWTQWLEQSRGLPPSLAGLLMSPSFATATLVSLVASRRKSVWRPLVVGAAILVSASLCLVLLNHSASLWALALLSCLFGVPTGLTLIGNQAAMYAQAPPDQTGTASGLLRTAQYCGAIVSSCVIGFAFAERASDEGLHILGSACVAASVLLLGLTLISRSLRIKET